MKLYIITLILLLTFKVSYAQSIEWVHGFGSTNIDKADAIVTDLNGNSIVVGSFTGTVDFDPSISNTVNLISSSGYDDAFICKYNPNGDLLWAKQIGGNNFDQAVSITSDAAGDLYITGIFNGNVDFDPGPGVYNITGFGDFDAFVVKLTANGDFVWAEKFGSGGSANGTGSFIKIDGNGDVIIMGFFANGFNFDPGDTEFGLNSSGLNDIFICKLTSLGDFIWSKGFGGSENDVGNGLTIDNNNNIYFTGTFRTTADFDPNAGVTNLSSLGYDDIFICKLNSSGDLQWVNNYGSVDIDEGIAIVYNNTDGNLYVTGSFRDTIDFDPSPTVQNLYANFQDATAYINKYDLNGNLIWANKIEANDGNVGEAMVVDVDGNIIINGLFSGIADFDLGAGISNLNSVNGGNFFFKIDTLGQLFWTKQTSGKHTYIYPRAANHLAVDVHGNVFSVGDFSGARNFEVQTNDFIFSSQGYEDIYVLKMSQKQIRGKVFLDASGDCIEDSGEYGLSGRLAEITPGNIIVQTDVNGYWFLDSLPAGTYNIDYDTSGNWMATCSPSSSFTISGSEFFYSVPSFGLKSGDPCAIPNVSIMIPTLRPCFTGQKIFVTVKNLETSTGLLVNSFVDITLDTMLTVTGANVPFTNLGNHIYRVNTGDLNLGEDSTFFFNVTLHCDALIGQTICAKAEVFPADDCIFDSIPSPFSGGVLPCTLPYDGSSIEVGSWCSNDTIYFSIANIGIGDMECYSPYLIYQDTQLIIQDSILLLSGEIDTLIFSGDGRTWRLEAQQHPLHPGNSNPNTTIELCGNQNNWTSGLVNLFPMDDANPNVDIFCVEASASYDPNDKTGYPLGITENNFIEPNQSMEYVIRFQNTGTDTAFTVVIRDTLDLDFDVFSVISGASSHSYAFRIYGPRVLEWTFSNIMLPDSTTDEPGSNGFVKFIVNQKTNLVPGTELNNEVGIYFDFNSPIITNTTSHIIHIPEDEPDFSGVENIALSFCDSIEVNGMYYSNPGMYYYSENDTLYMLDLQEGTLSVNIIQNGFVLSADIFGVSYRWLDCNNGYSIISGETNSSFTATVNGSYAVEVSENGCTDTSACFTISTIGVTENSFGENIRIYPNPSNGKLFIDLGRNTEKMNVSVKNAIGQIVYSETYQNKNILELNLNVERGIYFLELMSEEGSKKVIKFILE